MAEFRATPGRSAEGTDPSDAFADAGRRASETVKESGEQALDRTGEAARTARDTVLEHPIATLAIVAGLAFAIGALWKIGSSRQQSGHRRLLDRLGDLTSQAPRGWR
jgi:hypothetical protein